MLPLTKVHMALVARDQQLNSNNYQVQQNQMVSLEEMPPILTISRRQLSLLKEISL